MNVESGVGSVWSASTYNAVLDQYCGTCQNERLRAAELVLANGNLGDVNKKAVLREKVLDKLQTAAMSPVGVKRPGPSTYNALSGDVADALDRSATYPHPGRPAIHRLNHAEYTNAIREMRALNIDVTALLPADDAGHRFDNLADVLSASPFRSV